MKNLLCAFVIIPSLILTGAASADTTVRKQVSAVAGKPARLSAFWAFGPKCEMRTVDVKTVENARHGRVEPKVIARKIVPTVETDFSGRCAGRRTKAIELYYRSDPSYRGSDRVVVSISDGGKNYRYVFDIKVR